MVSDSEVIWLIQEHRQELERELAQIRLKRRARASTPTAHQSLWSTMCRVLFTWRPNFKDSLAEPGIITGQELPQRR